jgi:hypothetical protein
LLVVVSLNGRAVEGTHELDALTRVGVVADNVPHADKAVAGVFLRVRHDGMEGV